MTLNRRTAEVQDSAFLFVLGAVALYGMHDTFHGVGYLLTGVVGVALGIACVLVLNRFGQSLLLVPVLMVVVFFLLGGLVALSGLGLTWMLPLPATLAKLASTTVDGWKDMLTTLPPVDGGALLTLPYLLGLLTGAAGMVAAKRLRWAPAPALVALLALAAVIALGVQHPTRAVPVGMVFAALSLGWIVLRAQRDRPRLVTVGSARGSRTVVGAVMCAALAVLAGLLGPHLPGVGGSPSVVRSSIVPPFDVGQYPSPLVGFRRFTQGYSQLQPEDGLYKTRLFKVTGLPAGSVVRIAALDSYDGNVWGAANVAGSAEVRATTPSDTFLKVGQEITDPARGRHVTATVKMLSDALGPWVPSAGGLTSITFTDPSSEYGSSDFRYNVASGTGVMPAGLTPGDTYSFSAVMPATSLTAHTQLASGALPGVADYAQFQPIATRWAGNAGTPLQQVQAVAAYLKAHGHYTDGAAGYQSYAAGHSLYRLTQFVSTAGDLAGDDEQYAAVMALVANDLGVPARVVVGAQVPASGVVTGADVHAWVELEAADGTWKTLPQTAFMGTTPPRKQRLRATPSVPPTQIPPPAPTSPPATAGQPLQAATFHRSARSVPAVQHTVVDLTVAAYAGLPVIAIVLACAVIVALKQLRRGRRRSSGTPARRIAAAWWELLDHSHDFGYAAPRRATRREQALALGTHGLPSMTAVAARFDAVIFARAAPNGEAAAACWREADAARRELAASQSRARRLRAALNLVTLRPGRGHRS